MSTINTTYCNQNNLYSSESGARWVGENVAHGAGKVADGASKFFTTFFNERFLSY